MYLIKNMTSISIFLLSTLIGHCQSFLCHQTISSYQNNVHMHHNNMIREISNKKVQQSAGRLGHQTELDMIISGETITAASTILLSSGVGFASDRIGKFKDSGIVITLFIAAMLSNINIYGFSVPTFHPLYDLCWSHFLPASLALILFTSSNKSILHSGQTNANRKGKGNISTREQIVAVGIPFLIGSFGSVLGCLFSATIQVRANSFHSFKAIAMDKVDACLAVGCLSASYIGGTVNFFAAARIITKHLEMKYPLVSTAKIANLLSAMAAADLIIMAVYFGAMTKLMSWKGLQTWFPQRNCDNENRTDMTQNSVECTDKDDKSSSTRIPSTGIMSALAWLVVELSNILEKKSSKLVPGMGCAFVAIFGVLVNQVVVALARCEIKSIKHVATKFSKDMSAVAPRLSEFCFYLLFAAIGTSANLKEAMTHGLSCIYFASTSLMIHIFITFFGSMLSMRAGKDSRWLRRVFPLSTNEICIASNAAIGGASTAAALAGKSTHNTRNLVISATFWGILGYAVSTSIGVSIALRLLRVWVGN